MKYYEYQGLCLCPVGGRLPSGAAETAHRFAPLCYLVDRDPAISRCLWEISDAAELDAPEDWRMLLPRMGQGSMAVLNTAFPRCFEMLPRLLRPKTAGLRLTLVGLGDVGGTLLTALKLLGEEIDEIGIYDPCQALVERYCLELGQVLGRKTPRIVPRAPEALFDCDLFLFAASLGVPPVGAGGDVRMAQFEKNREMLKQYAKMARENHFTGLFCQISDPVDLLARSVFLQSNRDPAGNFDWQGLLPEQVVGFGLGVMSARAAYYARQLDLNEDKIAVFGPHGAGLVAANDCENYDSELSEELTRKTVEANRVVRALGFKPYIAPALSSACLSILDLVRGRPFYGAIPMGGVYFGCRCVRGAFGFAPVHQPLHERLQARIERAWTELKEMEPQCRQ